MQDLPDLGDLERDVMQLVWAHAPITADDVRARLGRALKESTIRTVLSRLEAKGFVTHTTDRSELLSRAEALFAAIESGVVTVDIRAAYPLQEARRAHADLQGRRTIGASILLP